MTFNPRAFEKNRYIVAMIAQLTRSHFTHVQLLRGAGLFTWACVGIPLLLRLPTLNSQTSSGLLLLSYLLFGVAYGYITWRFDERLQLQNWLALFAMTIAAVAITYFTRSGLGAILLIVSAGVLPWLFPLGLGLLLLVGQNFAMLPVFAYFEKLSLLEALLQVGLYFGSCSFMFMTAWIGTRQFQARQSLYQVNLELRAAQAMLSETERTSERLRISRELHDLVGHHLTALSLNLEVASHLADGKTLKHVLQAQTISKLLLSDVREVVSTLRESDPIYLGRALIEMADGIPNPKVHLKVPEPFILHDSERAQVILRLAQEILTNAIKHAQAKNLWLTLNQTDAGIEISAYDDGRGADLLRVGNGLAGMHERLSAYGGTLMCESAPGRGFQIVGFLPIESPKLAEVNPFSKE